MVELKGEFLCFYVLFFALFSLFHACICFVLFLLRFFAFLGLSLLFYNSLCCYFLFSLIRAAFEAASLEAALLESVR